MVLFILLALWILAITMAVLLVFFIVQMLADVAGRAFENKNEKIVWLLAIAFSFGLGALVYFVWLKKKPTN